MRRQWPWRSTWQRSPVSAWLPSPPQSLQLCHSWTRWRAGQSPRWGQLWWSRSTRPTRFWSPSLPPGLTKHWQIHTWKYIYLSISCFVEQDLPRQESKQWDKLIFPYRSNLSEGVTYIVEFWLKIVNLNYLLWNCLEIYLPPPYLTSYPSSCGTIGGAGKCSSITTASDSKKV